MKLRVRQFEGLQNYTAILSQMQDWVQQNAGNQHIEDQLWLLEHQPVFTLGQAGDEKHILNVGNIPVIRSDRGGQVTYHGPGQLMIYTLLNLDRLQLNTRTLVRQLEQWIISYLATLNIEANNDVNAPGVYTDGKKICSIGLRIKQKMSYHGLAFNVDMDLTPFNSINPCGFAKLPMTDLNRCVSRSMQQVIKALVPLFVAQFGYHGWEN